MLTNYVSRRTPLNEVREQQAPNHQLKTDVNLFRLCVYLCVYVVLTL